MNSPSVLIFGAGNIGTRHLQSILNFSKPLVIDVVEPFNANKIKIQKFIDSKSHSHVVHVYSDRTHLKSAKYDLIICATNSRERLEIVRWVSLNLDFNSFVLEKVAFTSCEEFKLAQQTLGDSVSKTWVNCPRRYIPLYRDLKTKLESYNGYFHLKVYGQNWGLGCNSVHFLDLCAFLTGKPISNLSFFPDSHAVVESRRADYLEFYGDLFGKSEDGLVSIHLACKDSPAKAPNLELEWENERWLVEEAAGQGISQENGKWQSMEFSFPYQSELSEIYLKETLSGNGLGLTPFLESKIIHSPLLDVFIKMLSETRGTVSTCPIT